MGRYSNDSGESGFEFLGLVPAEPSSAPVQPGSTQPPTAQPSTRREARERGDGTTFPTATPAPTSGHALLFPEYTAHRITPPVPDAGRARTARPAVERRTVTPRLSGATKRELQRLSRASGGPVKRKASASSKLLSLGAMLFAAALIVGMSVPANAFIGDIVRPVVTAPVSDTSALQTVAVPADSDPVTVSRDSFSVVSYQELMEQSYGKRGYSFTPTTGAVRWPFPYSVPISDGWGPRVAPCDTCSTFHQGVDFTPGTGTPIYAIADGVVASHDDTNYGLGNNVVLSHVINGQNVDSVYAHMLTGSSSLKVGDHLKVGDFIGLVGDTGSSVGAHLHFEIHIDKVPIDPFPWLQENTTNVS